MRVDSNDFEMEFIEPQDTKGYRFVMRELMSLVGKTVTGVGLLKYDPFIGNGNDVFYTLLLTDNETGQEQLFTILRDDEGNGGGSFETEYLGYVTAHKIRKVTKAWKDELGPDPFEFGDIFESDVE